MNIDYPFHFDSRGRTALAGHEDHIRDLIEQLLFTRRGERVNRPEFGGGLYHMVFEPNSAEIAATLRINVAGDLESYLGDLIAVESLDVRVDEATLHVDLQYVVRRTGNVWWRAFSSKGTMRHERTHIDLHGGRAAR